MGLSIIYNGIKRIYNYLVNPSYTLRVSDYCTSRNKVKALSRLLYPILRVQQSVIFCQVDECHQARQVITAWGDEIL